MFTVATVVFKSCCVYNGCSYIWESLYLCRHLTPVTHLCDNCRTFLMIPLVYNGTNMCRIDYPASWLAISTKWMRDGFKKTVESNEKINRKGMESQGEGGTVFCSITSHWHRISILIPVDMRSHAALIFTATGLNYSENFKMLSWGM